MRDFPGGSDGKKSACKTGDPGLMLRSGISLEKGMATHSSILAWRILWTEEPGGLPFIGLQESDTTEQLSLSLSQFPEESPNVGWWPGESQGWGSLVGCRLWDRTESDMTEAT